jgi:hypothetical protein
MCDTDNDDTLNEKIALLERKIDSTRNEMMLCRTSCCIILVSSFTSETEYDFLSCMLGSSFLMTFASIKRSLAEQKKIEKAQEIKVDENRMFSSICRIIYENYQIGSFCKGILYATPSILLSICIIHKMKTLS